MTRQNRKKIEATKWTWALFAAVFTAGVVEVWQQASLAWDWQIPRFPLPAAIVIFLVAAAALVFSLLLRRRTFFYTHAVTILAIGKTFVIAGSALFGGYFVLAAHNLRIEAAIPRETLGSAVIAGIAAAILIVAGYRLQYACRIRKNDSDA
ncbi:MAG: DUF3180 family protein [Propionibacteriaceae bacterium]|nr:DUF3180 family protein [Propionibacteriaceae bacterium]